MLNIPLMSNNIDQSDINELISFLRTSDRFTNGPKVREFENAWSDWLGVSPEGKKKKTVFVNSGSSANYMTMATLRELCGEGEVILSPIEWSSDISSVMAAGMKPVFADVNLSTFAMAEENIIEKINLNTKAILITHVLGHNGLTENIIKECHDREILIIEDVCESHGATYKQSKCGTIGRVSNFSFYYAHHMSTIEGGVICTDDEEWYRTLRMFRSHGMLRECDDVEYMDTVFKEYPELHPEFIFMVPGYNMRSTELNAVIGLNQLKRLDDNIKRRQENYRLFLSNLDSEKYFTDFMEEGSSNYAFIILLRKADERLFERVIQTLKKEDVEFRRGTAGGGNLTRQPFVRKRYPEINPNDYTNAEFIHRFGLYTGNYPDLSKEKILGLCEVLNKI